MKKGILSTFLILLILSFNLTSVKAVTTVDKATLIKQLLQAREAELSEMNGTTITTMKDFVQGHSTELVNGTKSVYQASPPQLKFVIGVGLIGAGIIGGTIQGKDVVEEYLNSHPDIANKIGVEGDRFVITCDGIQGIIDFSKQKKIDTAFSPDKVYTKDDNIIFPNNYYFHGNIAIWLSGNLFYSGNCFGYPSGSPSIIYDSSMEYYRFVWEGVTGRSLTPNTSIAGTATYRITPDDSTVNNTGTSPYLESTVLVDGSFTVPNVSSIPSTGTDLSIGYSNDLSNDPILNVSSDVFSSTDTGTNTGTNTNTGTDTGTSIDNPTYIDMSRNLNVPENDTPSLDFSPLQLSLSDKFPFCIPFDLAKSIKSFSTSSQAPVFTFQMPSTIWRGNSLVGGSFKIDMGDSKLTPIVLALRYFILLVFVVSLIKLTRTIIRG